MLTSPNDLYNIGAGTFWDETMTTYRVYIHYTKDTGVPFYVGRAKTSWRPQQISKRNIFWERVYAKHGRTYRVIGGTWTKEYANLIEQRLISLYSRKFKLTNLTKGGDGCLGMTHTDVAKNAMSKARKGVAHSAEWREKISKAHLARLAKGLPHNGANLTAEGRLKIGIAGRNKTNKPTKLSRPVLCVTTGIVYNSIAHAAREVGADEGNLGKHLHQAKHYKTIKGMVFTWQ